MKNEWSYVKVKENRTDVRGFEMEILEMMTLTEKLNILSDAAKYDVACTSSGTDRKNDGTGIGNCVKAGICHSFSADGRCISLLKILSYSAFKQFKILPRTGIIA